METTIVDSDPLCPDALSLLQEAAQEARELYPEFFDPLAPAPTNQPTPAHGAYFVAYSGTQALGMGAHRPIDEDSTEVRRMYVLRQFRRTGLARLILSCIEDHAREQGFRRLVLETGNRQLPAISLYESYGFHCIETFGPYLGDPTSVCFEKAITLK